VRYDGDARIDGVPGFAAPIPIDFLDIAGSTCGSLLPTGNALDVVDGVAITCIDNGMPVVCLLASDVGLTGYEDPSAIEADLEACRLVESLRLKAGLMMNLGDVSSMTVPKMSLLAKPEHGGVVTTRTFIPKRVHEAIGVFGAVSVARRGWCPARWPTRSPGFTTCRAHHLADRAPYGYFDITMDVSTRTIRFGQLAALLRTARVLMRGVVYVPRAILEYQ